MLKIPSHAENLLSSINPENHLHLTLTFSSNIGSPSELHAMAKAMGITIYTVTAPGGAKTRPKAPPGAVPPFAVTTGDKTQPALAVTYQFSPKKLATIQLVNEKERRVDVIAYKNVVDDRIEDLLTFLGQVVEVRAAAPPEEDVAVAPSQPPMSIRDALRQSQQLSGPGH